LKGEYDERCDNWSLGVIMYVLLCGNPPFYGENQNDTFAKILDGKYSMTGVEWKNVSKQAKDLIHKLLVPDPEQRYSSSQALEHEWFKVNNLKSKQEGADPAIANILRNFRSGKKFKKEVLKVMVNFLTEGEIKKLTENFRYFDQDSTGYISVGEMQTAMKDLGHHLPEKEIENLMKTIKIDSSQPMINYSEFIAATMNKKDYLTRERLWAAFKHFDIENTNEITPENIVEAMARAGRKIPLEDIRKMVREVDLTKDGKLSFEEFVHIMKFEDDKYEMPYTEDKLIRLQSRSSNGRSRSGVGSPNELSYVETRI